MRLALALIGWVAWMVGFAVMAFGISTIGLIIAMIGFAIAVTSSNPDS